ncbi:hypothetical protein PROFUN_16117 [Planoprotostelium fungivorum]|uniref:Uncharacterized protein n=1 Tax=Planoprotostelium fungivorum TaxID=1890364 RepID=A0A2P6MSN0_9EUKA|nr:hypothetical protein PROFUN_16117 [Planoprotostelium fungivorum]
MTQWWNSAYNDMVSQLPQGIVDCLKYRIQNIKIRGKNNKKQCMKMNNKRYEERLQELLEEKEKESAAEIKKVQVECTSKTMSLELQLEEMHKTLDQRDKFITKQMIPLRKHKAHNIACFTFQVQPAGDVQRFLPSLYKAWCWLTVGGDSILQESLQRGGEGVRSLCNDINTQVSKLDQEEVSIREMLIFVKKGVLNVLIDKIWQRTS